MSSAFAFTLRSFRRLRLAAVLVLLGLAGATSAYATAPTYTVTVTADAGAGSFRDAITQANTGGVTCIINFDATAFAPGGGPYTIQLASVLPNLAVDVTITGPGANVVTVRGQGDTTPYRIFTVMSGHTVAISGLTITNGKAAGTNGAPGTDGQGGAILNSGSLTLTACVFSGNSAQGGSGTGTSAQGGQGQGGAIYSSGPLLTVQRCTFTSNSASAAPAAMAPLLTPPRTAPLSRAATRTLVRAAQFTPRRPVSPSRIALFMATRPTAAPAALADSATVPPIMERAAAAAKP